MFDEKQVTTILVSVIVSFITALIVALITHRLRISAWKQESRHSLFKARYEDGVKFLEDFSRMLGKRHFLLQRLVWSLDNGIVSGESFDAKMKEYYEVVKEWNFNLWSYRNKIRLLLGEGFAREFLDYSDDNRANDKHSLHYIFQATHDLFLAKVRDPIATKDDRIPMDSLNKRCSAYLERLTSAYMLSADNLVLVQHPTSTGSAEEAHERNATRRHGA